MFILCKYLWRALMKQKKNEFRFKFEYSLSVCNHVHSCPPQCISWQCVETNEKMCWKCKSLPKYETLFLRTRGICPANVMESFWDVLVTNQQTNRCRNITASGGGNKGFNKPKLFLFINPKPLKSSQSE